MSTIKKSPAAAASVQTLRVTLNQIFQERESVIDGMLVTLLSRQALYMLGPPGTGKSELCRVLCRMLGGKYFEKTMNKFTTPEELFGPVSFKSMENDVHERVVEGMLPTAHIVFIDEAPRGSPSILDTLLPVMNERKFKNGQTLLDCPIEAFYSAGNSIPDAEGLEAFWDRMVLRYEVQAIQEDANMKALLKFKIAMNAGTASALPHVPLEAIKAEQEAAMALVIPEAILDLALTLRTEIKNAGLEISDRRWTQTLNIVKAQAYLNGHAQVEADDLEILEALLWSSPEEIKKVRQMVAKVSNPLGEAITSQTDAIQDILGRWRKKEAGLEAFEVQKKLKKSLDTLKNLRKPGMSNSKLDKAIAQVDATNQKFVRDELGVE